MFSRIGLKVNACKRKVMVLVGEEGLECEGCVDGIRLDHVDGSGTDEADCNRKLASGREVAGAIRSLGNARSLQLECTKVLHAPLLVPVLTYGSGGVRRNLGLWL